MILTNHSSSTNYEVRGIRVSLDATLSYSRYRGIPQIHRTLHYRSYKIYAHVYVCICVHNCFNCSSTSTAPHAFGMKPNKRYDTPLHLWIPTVALSRAHAAKRPSLWPRIPFPSNLRYSLLYLPALSDVPLANPPGGTTTATAMTTLDLAARALALTPHFFHRRENFCTFSMREREREASKFRVLPGSLSQKSVRVIRREKNEVIFRLFFSRSDANNRATPSCVTHDLDGCARQGGGKKRIVRNASDPRKDVAVPVTECCTRTWHRRARWRRWRRRWSDKK